MDELERRLRDGLRQAVDPWNPSPDRLSPQAVRRRPHLRLAAVVAAAVVMLGAIGVPVTLKLAAGHSRSATLAAGQLTASATATPGCPGLQFLSESAFSSEPLPTGCPAPSQVPGASATHTVLPSTVVGPPAAVALPALTVPPAGTAPTTSPTPGASLSAGGYPTCRPADFALTVHTGQPSYPEKSPVTITALLMAKRACDTAVDYRIAGSITDGSAGGKSVEDFGGTCRLHDGVDPECPYSAPQSQLVTHWRAGQGESVSDMWSQLVVAGPADPRYAAPGDYLVSVTAGPLTAATHVAIAAPACSPGQLSVALTADSASYAQGQTARLTGTVANTSSTACEAAIGDVEDPVAIDSSGATVWTDCEGTGDAEQSDGSCLNDLALRSGSQLVPAGGQIADLGKVFSWDLGATGSTVKNPKPVPDGTYTLTWKGLPDTAPASVTVTVTG